MRIMEFTHVQCLYIVMYYVDRAFVVLISAITTCKCKYMNYTCTMSVHCNVLHVCRIFVIQIHQLLQHVHT